VAALPRKREAPQPHDVTVSWSTAHNQFLRWYRTGIWTPILTAIGGEVRTRSGRRRRPTAAVVDSSSVKASPVAAPLGFPRDDKSRWRQTPRAGRLRRNSGRCRPHRGRRAGSLRLPETAAPGQTNGFINYCRRLHRRYEITLTAHQGFLILSQIALLLRRLDRSQLFDTL